MPKVRKLVSVFLSILIVISLSLPAMADKSDNDHSKNAELKNGLTINGKVNCGNDKVDYYKLNGQAGSNPRFKLTGSDHVIVYVYDDGKLIGNFKKRKSGKSFKINGNCMLKVVAKAKDEDNDDVGGGTYRITIKPNG